MAPVLAAVAQLTSVPSISTNLRNACSLIRKAGDRGAKIIFLPEASDFIAPAGSVHEFSRPIQDTHGENEFLDGVRQVATEQNIWVNVCVHQSSKDDVRGRCYNTNVLISDSGEVLRPLYQKVHLFDVDLAPSGPTIKESNTTIPGDSTQPLPLVPFTPVGNLGLQTCYDLRFAPSSHALTKSGAHSLTYPSAFATHTGAAHWETLLRARAIENQCYVFGSAQVGEHFPGRRSYGHAMIIDPWGTVVAQCPQNTPSTGSLCFAEVDIDWVSKIRREMPMGW